MVVSFFPSSPFAEAPSKHVVETARAHVRTNPQAASALIREFASIRVDDAESGVHRFFQKHGLAADVKIERANLGEGKEVRDFPYVKLSSWVMHLLGTGRFTKTFSGAADFATMKGIMVEFWKRFEDLYPRHQVFELARNGALQLSNTVPYFTHSDEGRTFKHEAIYVLSAHACLGRGTAKYIEQNLHQKGLTENEMGLNFVGGTMSTQFLFGVMMKRTMNKNPNALDELIKLFAADASALAHEGIVAPHGERFWMLHINTKGDLPALIRMGKLTRTFWHISRGASTRRPGDGICHLCKAGQEANPATGAVALPFEDVSTSPIWENTMMHHPAWNERPAILAGLPCDPGKESGFFSVDIWHNFHLGVAKHYVASSLVMVIESDLLPPGSIEYKLESISQKYKAFCRACKISPWLTDINRDALTFPQSSACPVGKWNKGSASTTMMLFLDNFCEEMIKGKTDNTNLVMIVSLKDFSQVVFQVLGFGSFSVTSIDASKMDLIKSG